MKQTQITDQTSSPSVLGVYLGHDLGACLLRGGQIVAMIEEERLNRFKHGRPNSVAGLWNRFAGKFGYFPWASVCYCLEAANLSLDEVDLIVVGDALWARAAADTIRSIIPIKNRDKVIFTTEPKGAAHHYHHALSTFLSSPFEEAAVLVIDGDGNSDENGYEAETGFYFSNREGQHRLVFKNRYKDKKVPRSGIGWTYEQVTLLLGFANSEVFVADPGKTMGLSAYGKGCAEFAEPWLMFDGFKIDFSGFHHWLKASGYDVRVLAFRDGLATSQNEIPQHAKDLAFKVQVELEEAMLHLATEMYRSTGSKNLCLAGGVALNCLSNGNLMRRAPFPNLFIHPAANDAGQCLGLAYRGHLMLMKQQVSGRQPATSTHCISPAAGPIHPIRHAFGGKTYKPEEIRDVLSLSGLPFQEFGDDNCLAEDAASELAAGQVVGWFQGGSEFGPRALGHRSILAHPGLAGTKDQLNSHVKFREAFRPFAPAVLLESAGDVFEIKGVSPYMLLAVMVRQDWRARVPAITHVDGTARVQTVDPRSQPLLHELICAFKRRTGIPLIVNTSFNLRGMPIVESPFDALQCFLLTDMDALYLGRYKVRQAAPEQLFLYSSADWRVETEHDPVTRKPLVKAKRRGLEFILEGAGPLTPRISTVLNGQISLRDAYLKASRAEKEGSQSESLNEVVHIFRRMVRLRPMQMRIGSLEFGLPVEETHWWQEEI